MDTPARCIWCDGKMVLPKDTCACPNEPCLSERVPLGDRTLRELRQLAAAKPGGKRKLMRALRGYVVGKRRWVSADTPAGDYNAALAAP